MPQWLEQAKRRVSDAVSNPGDFAQMLVDQLRNYNAEVVPTAAGGELTNRPMTRDERNTKYMDLAQAAGPGSIRSGDILPYLLRHPDFPRRIEKAISNGKSMESVFRRHYGFNGVDPEYFNPIDSPVRYETSRKLYDPGVVHYDASGGSQIFDIMTNTNVRPSGGRKYGKELLRGDANSQLRVGDLSLIKPEDVVFVPEDRWYMGRNRGLNGKYEFYANEVEGVNPLPSTTGEALPKANDILNDPELRRHWNMSLAAPSDSDFHLLAKILRGE